MGLFAKVKSAAKAIANKTKSAAQATKKAVVSAAKKASSTFKNAAQTIANKAKSAAKAIANKAKSAAKATKKAVVNAAKKTSSTFKNAAQTIANKAKSAAKAIAKKAKSAAKATKEAVVKAAKKAASSAKSAAKAFVHKAKSAGQAAKKAVLNAAKKAASAFKKAKSAAKAAAKSVLQTAMKNAEEFSQEWIIGPVVYCGGLARDLAAESINTVMHEELQVLTKAKGVVQWLNDRFFDPLKFKGQDGYIIGADGRAVPRGFDIMPVLPTEPKCGPPDKLPTALYVNGINSAPGDNRASIGQIANKTCSRMTGIYNATEGLGRDLTQCLDDKQNIGKNPAADALADLLYEAAREGKPIHIMAHSQGALITSRALYMVQNKLILEQGSESAGLGKMGVITVDTFGGAAHDYPDGPHYTHYINKNDPIPTVTGLGATGWEDEARAGHDAMGNPAKVIRFNGPIGLEGHSFDEVYLQHLQ